MNSFIQTRGIGKLLFPILLLIFFSMYACGGGGGGGSSAAPDQDTTTGIPSISNIQYSPRTATQNQGGGVVTVTGTIDFVDREGDLATLTINVYNAQGVLVATGTPSLQNVSGRTSGIIQIQQDVNTANIVDYTVDIYVTDTDGNISNKLTATFSVTASQSDSSVAKYAGTYTAYANFPGSVPIPMYFTIDQAGEITGTFVVEGHTNPLEGTVSSTGSFSLTLAPGLGANYVVGIIDYSTGTIIGTIKNSYNTRFGTVSGWKT